MWKQIRGQGLSYGFNLYLLPNEGHLCLSLYKATNLVGAYKEARAIIVSIFNFFFVRRKLIILHLGLLTSTIF